MRFFLAAALAIVLTLPGSANPPAEQGGNDRARNKRNDSGNKILPAKPDRGASTLPLKKPGFGKKKPPKKKRPKKFSPADIIERFDDDNNGQLSKDEIPEDARKFWRFMDKNKDGYVTERELAGFFEWMKRRAIARAKNRKRNNQRTGTNNGNRGGGFSIPNFGFGFGNPFGSFPFGNNFGQMAGLPGFGGGNNGPGTLPAPGGEVPPADPGTGSENPGDVPQPGMEPGAEGPGQPGPMGPPEGSPPGQGNPPGKGERPGGEGGEYTPPNEGPGGVNSGDAYLPPEDEFMRDIDDLFDETPDEEKKRKEGNKKGGPGNKKPPKKDDGPTIIPPGKPIKPDF